MKNTVSKENVQSLYRGILGFQFALQNGSVKAASFAETLGIHRSTALRLLTTIEDMGLLWQDKQTKSFHPSYENALQLFPAAMNWINLTESALNTLHSQTGRTTNIGILEGSDILYLRSRRLDPEEPSYVPPGTRNPCYATALGKAILAYKSEVACVDDFIHMGMVKTDERFPLNKERLASHLSQIRKTNYAVDDEDFGPGIRCIAAPIFDCENNVIAAVGISGTVANITTQLLPDLAQHVISAAAKITAILMAAEYIQKQ